VCFLLAAAFSSTTAISGPPPSCCLRVSRKQIHLDGILDYRWQIKGLCPVTVVMFYTQRGNVLCSDPDMVWTKRAIMKVEKERQRKEAEKIKQDSAALTPGPPAEGTGVGASPPTTPANSRGLQESAVSAAATEQHKAEGSAKCPKAPQGAKKQGIGGRRRRKNRKRPRKVKKCQ
ncbi:hypothetical protein NFI96_018613, partial [Prochilodus magdalenae]